MKLNITITFKFRIPHEFSPDIQETCFLSKKHEPHDCRCLSSNPTKVILDTCLLKKTLDLRSDRIRRYISLLRLIDGLKRELTKNRCAPNAKSYHRHSIIYQTDDLNGASGTVSRKFQPQSYGRMCTGTIVKYPARNP
jgi:hypothetical protein